MWQKSSSFEPFFFPTHRSDPIFPITINWNRGGEKKKSNRVQRNLRYFYKTSEREKKKPPSRNPFKRYIG